MAVHQDLDNAVRRYLSAVESGNADDIATMFAEDATLEDPVGGGVVHIGRDAITKFYRGIEGQSCRTELKHIRLGGNEAAFHFAFTIDGGMSIEPIDVMSFDDAGLIKTMKAYW